MIDLGVSCGPVEVRAAGYTDLIIRGLHAAAEGDVTADVDRLAIVEACRGLWRRALSACTVTPDRAAGVLSGALRAQMADCLLSSDGAYVAALDVQASGRLALHTASSFTVYGERPDPQLWRYELTIPTPSGGSVRRTVVRAGVLHAQWRADVRQPWLSAGPWSAGVTTSTLAARVERTLSREINSPVGTAIPVPMTLSDTAQDALETALASLKGGTALVPTTAGGAGAGQHDAPQRDWRTTRIGPQPTSETCDLRRASADDLIAAAGIPPGLFRTDADGTQAREVYRQWVHVSVEPVAAMIADAASELLEVDVAISTSELAGADVASRARAFRALAGRDANLEPDVARQIVGLA